MRPDMRSGPPPDAESRPKESSTRTAASVADQSDTLRVLVEKAAALIAAIGDQAARDSAVDAAAFSAGYELGFGAGRDVGYRAAERDMAAEWAIVAKKVQDLARRPTFRELEERRYPDRTREELLIMRGRDRFPLSDRQCHVCGGRISGGVE